MSTEIKTGEIFARLGNEISNAMNRAVKDGMDLDQACSVAVCVAVDYWRITFEIPATALSEVIEQQCNRPLPSNIRGLMQ